jgi:tetratricopeptide (TPR) repeat protein
VPKTKQLIKQTSTFLISSICCLICLEYSIRVFFPQKILPNLKAPAFGMRHALIPKIQIDMLNHRHYPPYRIVTNQKRLRSLKIINYKKSPNTYRVLLLGDSIMLGPGVNNEETLSFQLEHILNKNISGKKFEIINPSVGGWGLMDFYLYYKNEGHKYKADLIIISQAADDIRQNFTAHTTFQNVELKNNTVHLEGMHVDFQASSKVSKIMGWFSQYPFYNYLSQISHLLYLTRLKLNNISNKDSDSSRTHPKSSRLDLFFNNIPEIDYENLIWKQNAYEFQIPKIKNNPIEFFGEKSGLTSETITANTVLYFVIFNSLLHSIEQNKTKTLLLKIPSYMEVLKLTESNRLSNPQYNGSPYFKLDLLKPFSQFVKESNIPFFFPGDNHWSPAGHRLSAQILYNFLVSNHVLPYSLSKAPTLDIISQTMKSELVKANHRIAKELNANPFQIFVEGIKYKNKNQLEKAKASLKKYLTIKPDDGEASFQLGMIFLMQKKYDKAVSFFLDAQQTGHSIEKLKYKNFYIYASKFGKAWSLMEKGEFKKAIPFLKELSQMRGRFGEEAQNILALYYLKQGDIKMALFYKNKNKESHNFKNILKQKLGTTINQ